MGIDCDADLLHFGVRLCVLLPSSGDDVTHASVSISREFDTKWAEFVTKWAEFDTKWPEFVTKWAEFDTKCGEFGTKWAESDTKWAEFDTFAGGGGRR